MRANLGGWQQQQHLLWDYPGGGGPVGGDFGGPILPRPPRGPLPPQVEIVNVSGPRFVPPIPGATLTEVPPEDASGGGARSPPPTPEAASGEERQQRDLVAGILHFLDIDL